MWARVVASLGRWIRRTNDDPLVPPPLNRPLTADEDAALRWALWLEDFPGAEQLREQVDHVWVPRGLPTDLELEVSGAALAPVPDGVLDVMALVVGTDNEPEGIITVWVKDGFLSSLDFNRFAESMSTDYPSPDRLLLLDT